MEVARRGQAGGDPGRRGEAADLFLDLATLRTDADVGTVDDWQWTGATPELVPMAARLGADNLVVRCERLAKKRFG